MSRTRPDAAKLHQFAAAAANKVVDDLGIQAGCVYLGQVSGSGSGRSYTEELGECNIEDGARPSQQTIAFQWCWDGGTIVVDQRCDHVHQRGVGRPEGLWCSTALDKLKDAANAFAETHGPNILEEFGLPLQCVYKYQDESLEHDPAAWKVHTKRSRCKVVFEILLPGMTPFLTSAVRYDHIGDVMQNIHFRQS